MAATTPAPVPTARAGPQSNHRRRGGWVIASKDGTESTRPSSFDARRSAAAWNKGKGPSKASIPSRASSLASSPAPSPTIPAAPFLPVSAPAAAAPTATAPAPALPAPATSAAESVPSTSAPVPPPRDVSQASSSTAQAAEEAESSSNGKRRPSPPLLVPPKQTYRKVPSTRVLPASAYSDHQKFMAAANKVPRPTSVNIAGPSRAPTVALRSDLALMAANRRANSSSSSSTASTSSATQALSTPATSVASSTPVASQAKGKAKEVSSPQQSPLQRDEEGFFASGRSTVAQLVDTYNSVHRDSQQSTSSQNDRIQPKSSLLFSVNPLPALSEKSANSDLDDVLSSTSEYVSDSDGTSVGGGGKDRARPGKRRDSLRIELPPPPAQFKDRYPSITVDSTHASDSEASGTSNGAPRRRKRRSTASTSNRLGGDAEDDGEDDDDEYADDDSSWPSTPSTTPLEMYFTAADAHRKKAEGKRKAVQTTKEIIAPDPDALGMGRPMVVVTSPSTASEVSSDRRSSSGSGSTSDRMYSSSPPAAASVAPPPALSKIEEHPIAKADADVSGPPRRSLSFELPAVPRTRTSEEHLPTAAPVRSPSRAMAFLAKISPSRSANRSSVDLASTTRPDVSAVSVDLAKRMSLESQRRTSAEQRRSVELRPILLNAATRPTPRGVATDAPSAGPSSANSTATAQQVQQRRSSGRIPIRPNVVPYHSRRSSEVSVGSSNESPMLQDRGSFDKEAFDPRYSPSSQVTALTMPSPAVSTGQKRFSPQNSNLGHSPAGTSDRRLPTTNTAPKDRFAASMPSLHHPAQVQQPASRRSPSDERDETRPSAIGLLVDSQKGRMTRDNDSIAEWISVSVNDLPLPDATHAYGNGGAGEFSNEKQQAGKKLRKNKPWKLGRFAASEVLLPSKTSPAAPSAQTKRRSILLVKRASSGQVNETTRLSADSASSPHRGPFMRNLGFTTANRNVVLQNLCAERSISALAASTVYIAGCGRINVPQPGPLPAVPTKTKPQDKTELPVVKEKRQSRRLSKRIATPVVEVKSSLVSPSHSAEESRDAYLNVTEDRHTGYDLSGAMAGTVKSMVPETGDWSGSTGPEREFSGMTSGEEAAVVQTFRDYEDEGSDLFDSERSDSELESEDEMDYEDDEDVEVPVRFGQRVNLANRGAFGASSPQMRTNFDTASPVMTVGSLPESPVKSVVPSISLERLTPGVVMLHGSELRVCVEEATHSTRNATPLAYWKAVEVQSTNAPEDASQVAQQAEGQVRRQPSSRAMKLEQEVATGMFAAFVGNRSPRRQAAHRGSFDASGEQASPTKQGGPSANAKELVISKVNKSTFSVRSESRWIDGMEEQMIEITRRSAGSHTITHPTHLSSRESSQAGTPLDKLERAFPSPLLSNTDFAHGRTRSNRTDSSQVSLDSSETERVVMRIQRAGGRAFMASFQARNGQQWTWHASKLEASVMSPSRDHGQSQALNSLDGYDLSLRASDGYETTELATYSTESQVRNALGLFKPRVKAVPKPLAEDVSSVGPAIPPPAQVLPLGIPVRGMMGPMARREPQVPRRGIRGGPLLRPQPTAAGSAARHHGLWQHQRAAISTEAVVQVHNNAVNNARTSLQFDRPSAVDGATFGAKRPSVDTARTSREQERQETSGNKKMGELVFSAAESLDRDLVVVSLLAVMGAVKV